MFSSYIIFILLNALTNIFLRTHIISLIALTNPEDGNSSENQEDIIIMIYVL